MPDVSVLMPVFNGEVFLRPAIESALAQRGPSLELIIVDDGSSDDSPQIAEGIRDPRVRVIRNRVTTGLAAALNVGLKAAAGEFIARLDQDDIAAPNRLTRQVDVLRRMSGVMLVGSRARLIDASGTAIGTVERPCDETAIRWYHLLDNAFIHSSVMFRRREILDEFGGYDESLRLAEDWELWGRILRRHAVHNIADCLIDYRVTEGSMMGAIDASPSHPGRPLLRQIAATLVRRHVAAALGDDAVSAGDGDLLATFQTRIDGASLPEFLAAFDRLLNRFLEMHPEAAASPELRRTVARQFDAIAYRVSPPSRRAALRVYRRAVGRGIGVARFLPIGRAAVLAAWGRAGRDRMRGVRSAARGRAGS